MLFGSKPDKKILSSLNESSSFVREMLIEYAGVKDFDFCIPDVRGTSEIVYQQYIDILEKTANCIKNMNNDISSNPWRNTRIPYNSPKIVIQVEDKKNNISEALKSLVNLSDNLRDDYQLKFENNIEGIKELESFLFLACESPIVPKNWFDEGKIDILKITAAEQKRLQNDYFQNMSDIKLAVTNLKKLNFNVKIEIKNLGNAEDVAEICKKIEKIIDNDICFTVLNKDPSKVSLIASVEQETKENIYLTEKIRTKFNDDFFQFDPRVLENRFRTQYVSFGRLFKPGFIKDMKTVSQYLKSPKTELNAIDAHEYLKALKKINDNKADIAIKKNEMLVMFPKLYADEKSKWEEIHKQLSEYKNLISCYESAAQLTQIITRSQSEEAKNKNLFGTQYKNFLTDWDDIQKSIEWTEKMTNVYMSYTDKNSTFIKNVCSDSGFLVSLRFYADNIKEILESSVSDIVDFFEYFTDSQMLMKENIENVQERFEKCCTSFQLIDVWADYNNLRNKAVELGIGSYFEVIEKEKIPGEDILPVFEKRFLTLWNKSIMSD